jgi:chromosome segregation ATPase
VLRWAADEIERLREDSNTWARRCKEHMSSAKHMTARRDELERDLRSANDEIKRLLALEQELRANLRELAIHSDLSQ